MEKHRPTPGAFKKIGNRKFVLEGGLRGRLVDPPAAGLNRHHRTLTGRDRIKAALLSLTATNRPLP